MLCFASLHSEENKVALITGTSRGVGFEIAELLEENGFTVYGTIRNVPPKTEKEIHFLKVDLFNKSSIQMAVQTILDKEGRIDILINNAGYALVGPVESIVEPGLIQTRFVLSLGTKEIPNDPYREVTDGIEKEIQERIAHPELLTLSQTPKEIAEFLFSIIQEPHPKLRYQTSQDAKQSVAKKLLDLTGDLYLEEVQKYLESKKT